MSLNLVGGYYYTIPLQVHKDQVQGKKIKDLSVLLSYENLLWHCAFHYSSKSHSLICLSCWNFCLETKENKHCATISAHVINAKDVCTYLASSCGPILCRVLATLNLTLATLSFAKLSTVGRISFPTISGPHTSTRTWNRNKRVNLSHECL